MSGKPINFISEKEFGWMSNFFFSPFSYNGKDYMTVEHGFQSLKTADKAWQKRIRMAPSPREAKKLGRQCPMREDWSTARVGVMYELVLAKFQQNEDLAAKLLITGKRPINEDSPWDSYWGTGKYGDGENHMGRILMKVRTHLDLLRQEVIMDHRDE